MLFDSAQYLCKVTSSKAGDWVIRLDEGMINALVNKCLTRMASIWVKCMEKEGGVSSNVSQVAPSYQA